MIVVFVRLIEVNQLLVSDKQITGGVLAGAVGPRSRCH